MDKPEELARRLTAGLKQLPSQGTDASTAEAVLDLATLTEALHQKLASLPHNIRLLIHTADSGFASSGQWVDDAINAQTHQLKTLARATAMVATWAGPEGDNAEQAFVIRGNIRGWAHRWRKEDKGTAQVASDAEFVAFAADCLTKAGIAGNSQATIEQALGSDWRTAANK